MSIFGDTDLQQARELGLGELATEKPTGFMENAAAAWKEFNTNEALGALDTRRRSAYDQRIEQIQKVTGEKLDNPLPIPRNRLGLEDPISLVYNMFAGDDGAAEMQRMNDHESRIDDLRNRLPPEQQALIPTRQQIMDKLQAESKQAEKESSDIGSRATIPGLLGSISGGSAASLTQPEMLMTLPIGAPVRMGLMARMLTETAIGAGSQAAFEPTVQAQRTELGLESGVGEALENIGLAGLGAGVITGGIGGAGKLLGLVTRGGVPAFERAARRPATADEQALILSAQHDAVMERNTPFVTKDAETYAVKQQNENAAFEAVVQARPLTDDQLQVSEALTKTIMETDRATLRVLRNDDLSSIGVDAKLMQFKAGGDEAGVTDRLKGVTDWQTERAGVSLLYEFEDGSTIIADGHQRLGLAKRLAAEGKDVELPAITLRAADGVTPEMARARAAFKNIAEGTGTAQDAAKVLRDLGATPADMGLPPRSALVRDAEGLTNLDDEVFGLVINDVLSEQFGAIVGRLVQDPQLQGSIAGLLVKLKPANAIEADSIVRQALDAGATRETQSSLFGDEVVAESLYLERARVLDRGLKMLRRNIDTFRTLTERGTDIAGEGNILNEGANASRLDIERSLQQYISSQAHRKGMIGDALTTAAKAAKDTGRYSDAAREFVQAISDAAKRGEIDGRAVSGSRADLEPQYEGGEAPAFVDPSTAKQVDDATLNMFDDPASKTSEQQVINISNEMQADAFERAIQRPVNSEAAPAAVERNATNNDRRLLAGAQPQNAADDLMISATRLPENSIIDLGDDDLLNMHIPIGERIDADGTRVSQTQSVRDMLSDLEEDESFLEQLGVCGVQAGGAA